MYLARDIITICNCNTVSAIWPPKCPQIQICKKTNVLIYKLAGWIQYTTWVPLNATVRSDFVSKMRHAFGSGGSGIVPIIYIQWSIMTFKIILISGIIFIWLSGKFYYPCIPNYYIPLPSIHLWKCSRMFSPVSIKSIFLAYVIS